MRLRSRVRCARRAATLEELRNEFGYLAERDWRDDEYDAAHRDTPEWSLEVGP